MGDPRGDDSLRLWRVGCERCPSSFWQRKLSEHRCPLLGKENAGWDELERKSHSPWVRFYLFIYFLRPEDQALPGIHWDQAGRGSERLYPGNGWHTILTSLRALSVQPGGGLGSSI